MSLNRSHVFHSRLCTNNSQYLLQLASRNCHEYIIFSFISIHLSKNHIVRAVIGLTYGASNNILFHVPDTRQSFNYSCAASALQSVLVYWGIDIGENELIRLLNTTNAYDTDENDIVRVARPMGLEAESLRRTLNSLSIWVSP